MVVGGAIALLDPVQAHLMTPWSHAITWLSSGLLEALGVSVHAIGHVLESDDGRFAVSVENECNGAWAHLILLAAVLAHPATARERIVGLATAQPLLAICNVVRVATLFWLGVRAPALFRIAHVWIWQFLIIGCAMALFLVWTDRGVAHAD